VVSRVKKAAGTWLMACYERCNGLCCVAMSEWWLLSD